MKKNLNLFDGLNWTGAPNYPAGTLMKMMFDANKVKTILLNVPGNFHMDAHIHDTVEQLYVLKGEFDIGEEAGTEGMCFNFKAQEPHGPFKSKQGGLVLIIRHPAFSEEQE